MVDKCNPSCNNALVTISAPRPGERRPGGRTAKVRTAVLQATVAALAEDGYEALNIDDVAQRAGVHKTTVYRRWPTKAELVAAAVRERSQERVEVPDTGTFGGDLQALARAIAANIGSDDGSSMVKNLLAITGTSNVLAEETREFWAERLRLTGAIVQRAIARGELPAGVDANLVIEALIGPLYVRLLFSGEPIVSNIADQIARMVAAGAGVLDHPRLG
jgi:AcrR family transcriptional regulator